MDNAAGNEAARTSLPVVGGHEQKAAGNPLDNVPRMDAKKSRQGLPYLEDDSQVCFDWSKLVGGGKKKKAPCAAVPLSSQPLVYPMPVPFGSWTSAGKARGLSAPWPQGLKHASW